MYDYVNVANAISIHAPREGGDIHILAYRTPTQIFQSTPPARGATAGNPNQICISSISIHAPREGGDEYAPTENYDRYISIHAPREGGDGI